MRRLSNVPLPVPHYHLLGKGSRYHPYNKFAGDVGARIDRYFYEMVLHGAEHDGVEPRWPPTKEKP